VQTYAAHGHVFVAKNNQEAEIFFFVSPDLCERGELFDYLCPAVPPYVINFPERCARRIFKQLIEG